VANADREWFHLPETSPPLAAGGRLLPLSTELVPRYSAAVVASSQRRAAAQRWLDQVKGQTLKVRDKVIIT
jgi:hypothetical protein